MAGAPVNWRWSLPAPSASRRGHSRGCASGSARQRHRAPLVRFRQPPQSSRIGASQINRRHFLGLPAAAAMLRGQSARKRPPNVVFISPTTGAGATSLPWPPELRTPNIDRLAARASISSSSTSQPRLFAQPHGRDDRRTSRRVTASTSTSPAPTEPQARHARLARPERAHAATPAQAGRLRTRRISASGTWPTAIPTARHRRPPTASTRTAP